VAPDGVSLILSTEDTSEWKEWDRSKLLETLFESFEEVTIDFLPTTEVVSAQKELERLRIEADDERIIFAAELKLASAMVSNGTTDEELVTYPLTKGEIVQYFPTAGSSSSRDRAGVMEAMELVTVVGAHQDDFPNIYYTIR
jgi:hypothetical protein